MKTRYLFASLMVASGVLAVVNPAGAFVPQVDGRGRAALTECPATLTKTTIYHFDKVIFQLGQGNLVPLVAADVAQLNAIPRVTDLDIKIIDNPKTVADLKSKVLSFIGAQPNNAANLNLLRITDVEYATAICPKA